MICLVLPLLIGFGIDCVLGDPHSLPHPVVLIGKAISALECVLRRIFPKTPRGERAAGAVLWLIVAFLAAAVPALLLCLCGRVSPWLRVTPASSSAAVSRPTIIETARRADSMLPCSSS